MSEPRPGGPALARPLVIAIDGPAGAGKSTVAKLVAKRLRILRLDTGAMYRAATVGALANVANRDDAAAIAAWVCQRRIDFSDEGRVRLDGVTLTEASIRDPGVTREVWRVADNPACREHLVCMQQAIVAGREAVVEGRDATTVICPDAQLKIYLDASPEERARRRLAEWRGPGDPPPLAEIAADIRTRDGRDAGRTVGALRLADDAVPVVTDGMPVEAVVARIVAHAVQRQPFILERVVADQLVVGRNRSPGYVCVAGGMTGEWELGLTNPVPDRMPGGVVDLTCNHGGRQAGTLIQGAAVLVLAGRGSAPDRLVALPMLPQTWYVIEPGAWHACVQIQGTVCAWAESTGIREERNPIDATQRAELDAALAVLMPR